MRGATGTQGAPKQLLGTLHAHVRLTLMKRPKACSMKGAKHKS